MFDSSQTPLENVGAAPETASEPENFETCQEQEKLEAFDKVLEELREQVRKDREELEAKLKEAVRRSIRQRIKAKLEEAVRRLIRQRVKAESEETVERFFYQFFEPQPTLFDFVQQELEQEVAQAEELAVSIQSAREKWSVKRWPTLCVVDRWAHWKRATATIQSRRQSLQDEESYHRRNRYDRVQRQIAPPPCRCKRHKRYNRTR